MCSKLCNVLCVRTSVMCKINRLYYQTYLWRLQLLTSYSTENCMDDDLCVLLSDVYTMFCMLYTKRHSSSFGEFYKPTSPNVETILLLQFITWCCRSCHLTAVTWMYPNTPWLFRQSHPCLTLIPHVSCITDRDCTVNYSCVQLKHKGIKQDIIIRNQTEPFCRGVQLSTRLLFKNVFKILLNLKV